MGSEWKSGQARCTPAPVKRPPGWRNSALRAAPALWLALTSHGFPGRVCLRRLLSLSSFKQALRFPFLKFCLDT